MSEPCTLSKPKSTVALVLRGVDSMTSELGHLPILQQTQLGGG